MRGFFWSAVVYRLTRGWGSAVVIRHMGVCQRLLTDICGREVSVVCQQLLMTYVNFSQRLLTYIYMVYASGCQPIYTDILLAVVDPPMLILWATVYLSMRF
jgi:hypothetical protein